MIVLQIKKAKKMKKLLFVAVACAAISLTSCNGKGKPAGNVDTSKVDTSKVDTTKQDTNKVDSPAVEAHADSAHVK
jgi:hypothetical protein